MSIGVTAWLIWSNARRRSMLVDAAGMSVFIGIAVLVLGSLWKAALPDGQRIAGYDARAMVWYIAVAEAVVGSVSQRIMLDIGEDVRDGTMGLQLLRPIRLVINLGARELGRSLARSLVMAPVCGAVAYALIGAPPSVPALGTLLITLPLAVLVQMSLVFTFTASIFWLGDANAASMVLQKLVFLLGGMLLPIEVWPEQVAQVLALLPWASCGFIATSIAVGGSTDPVYSPAILIVALVFWSLAMPLVAAAAWSRGERVTVMGGG